MRADLINSSANLNPHDLLWIGGAREIVTDTDLPDWAYRMLDISPVVVVRRSLCEQGLVAIGIRGATRDERFAAAVPVDSIKKVVTPERLLAYKILPDRERIAEIPALRWFFEIVDRWAGLDNPWGPTGSVGFELATGVAMATPSSDLDLVMRSARRIERSMATALLASLKPINGSIDIQIEVPAGSFSLREFADARSSQLLVKTVNGPRLVNDPWKREQGEIQ